METTTQQTNGGTALAKAAGAATVEIAPRTGEIIRVGYDTLQGFEALQRIAKGFAASNLVPQGYQNNIANCMIAVEMAMRMGASPLMVMSNMYVVHNRPGWSGQFYIASFNNCGRFTPIRYRFTGQKGTDSWGCVAWARELANLDAPPLESSEITIALAKAEGWHEKNPKWRNMPQHMLMLRAGAWLVRTVAPELAMGLKTREELEDVPSEEEPTFTAPPAVTALPSPAEAGGEPGGAVTASTEEVKDTLSAAQEQLRLAAQESGKE